MHARDLYILSCSIMQAEQTAIYEANDKCKRPLTWAQIRDMPLTHRVSPSQVQLLLSNLKQYQEINIHS